MQKVNHMVDNISIYRDKKALVVVTRIGQWRAVMHLHTSLAASISSGPILLLLLHKEVFYYLYFIITHFSLSFCVKLGKSNKLIHKSKTTKWESKCVLIGNRFVLNNDALLLLTQPRQMCHWNRNPPMHPSSTDSQDKPLNTHYLV